MRAQLFSGPAGTRVMDIAREEGHDITPARAMEIVLEGDEIVSRIISEYVGAGADIILAPTIGANRSCLPDVKSVIRTNAHLIDLTRRAAPGLPVAAMVSLPSDSCTPRIRQWMTEQLTALADAGTDGFMLETLTSVDGAVALTECGLEAAMRAGRDIPVHVSLTPVPGFDIASAALRLKQYSPQSVGLNCFFPPESMSELLRLMPDDLPLSMRPAISQPGYEPISPEELCRVFNSCLDDSRLRYIGTCCGASPKHTEYLKKLINNDK